MRSVMIVDDEFDICNIITIFLQKRGFVAHGFTNPTSAFEYFQANAKSIDLVISDIRMPEMNGYELVKKVKTSQIKTKVVLMSAFEINYLEFSHVFPSIRIDEFISKPISLRNLLRIIEKLLHLSDSLILR